MVSKKIAVVGRSLVFRVLIWYSILTLTLFSTILTLLFINAKNTLHQNSARRLDAEASVLLSAYRSEGMQELTKVINRTAYTRGVGEVCYAVLDPQGKILVTSDMSQWANFTEQMDALSQAARQKQPVIETVTMPGIEPHVQVAYVQLEPDKILRAATVLRYTDAFLANLQHWLVITAMVVLTVVIIVGWVTLRWLIGRVTGVTNTALAISSISLSKRVPLSGSGDEIDRLAYAFNGMLDRIELLINGLGEVTDNVAHDLKSPLARIRVDAESLLSSNEADAATNEIAGHIIEESDGLLEMINTTLEIKAIDIGAAAPNFAKVDIADVVAQACELFEMLAQEKGVVLHIDSSGPIMFNGDLRHLQRAFANLIDNAVKYTDAGGKVDVHIQSDRTNVRVVIADTGVGIAPESLARIFERFYRADESRRVPGLGLGLSLAESIIKAHGGRIEVESTAGVGSTFTVILPFNAGQNGKLPV